MIKDNDSEAFSDDFRTNIFGKWTKMFMGWEDGDPDFVFEYMDILLTANTKLCKHMDYLDNDMTEGYDFCVVYSHTCTIRLAPEVEESSCYLHTTGIIDR